MWALLPPVQWVPRTGRAGGRNGICQPKAGVNVLVQVARFATTEKGVVDSKLENGGFLVIIFAFLMLLCGI